MNVRDAWSTLGRDLSDVLGEIRRVPVAERAEAAERELEKARGLSRRLMGLHHPDRNPGDAAAADRFRRVQEAIRAIEEETAALKEKLRSREAAPSRHDVFIRVDKPR